MIDIDIDREACIGAGNCVRLARGVFALDDQEVAVLVDPTAADDEDLRSAERSCPAGAIALSASVGRSDR